MHLQKGIYLLLAVLIAITLTPTTKAELGKLRRVRRGLKVAGKYFVHMKEDVPVEQIQNFTKELEGMAENDRTFVFRLFGIIDSAAHGFGCEMSKKSLLHVSQSYSMLDPTFKVSTFPSSKIT